MKKISARWRTLYTKAGFSSFMASLLAILCGLVVGFVVLLVSLELDEVMSLSDRILVIYEGEIVGELDPKTTTAEEMGLYMAGAKRKGA